jgi:lysophospholipase L1-like esterase
MRVRSRRGTGRVAMITVFAVALSMMTGGAAAAADPINYVALGDSYAAGPGILPIDPNLACQRSERNYPNVAAAMLGAELNDVTCSGATVDDLTTNQSPTIPPQLNALTPDTDLVSLTIGGNDVGLIQLALSCVNLLPEPIGVSCARQNTAGGTDLVSERIAQVAPTIGAAIDAIKQRSPQAKVLLVGYGIYLRPNGCYPITPLFRTDANYIQAKVNELVDATAAQAAAHGATFVDTRVPGHDACSPPAQKWLEGFIPTSVATPLHPNANGMDAFGAMVAAAAG